MADGSRDWKTSGASDQARAGGSAAGTAEPTDGRQPADTQPADAGHQDVTRGAPSETPPSWAATPNADQAAPTPAKIAYDIAQLAHELKTPLNAISTASEIMKDEQLGGHAVERYKTYSADIHRAAAHALRIIDRLLNEAAGRADPGEVTTVDVGGLLRNVISELVPLANERAVELDVTIADAIPNLIADAVGVRQMLINLLTNALKFTPAGGRVSVEATFELDGPLRLAVIDTGPGMTSADIEKALSASAEMPPQPRPGGGFGMGLAISQRLAIANGADLTLAQAASGGLEAAVTFARDRVVPV